MSKIERKWITDQAVDHTKIDPSDNRYLVKGLTVGPSDGTFSVNTPKFTVSSPTGNIKTNAITATGAITMAQGSPDSTWVLKPGTYKAGDLGFKESGVELLYLDGALNQVGINNRTPSETLDIVGTFRASQRGFIGGNFEVGLDLTVDGNASVVGSATIDGDFHVGGSSYINGDTTVSNDSTVMNNLDVCQKVHVGKAIGVGTYNPIDMVHLSGSTSSPVGLRLQNDGTTLPLAWGYNNYGQLGNDSTNSKSSPIAVLLNNVVKLSKSSQAWHELAIDSAGMIWAWGLNDYGQLGNDTVDNKSSPVSIARSGSYIAVAAGTSHSLAIDSAGRVWAWGFNDWGQLGDRTIDNKSSPVSIARSGSYIAVAAGNAHSLAIDSAGMVWAWGLNAPGQLGNNKINEQSSPVSIARADSYIAVAAGTSHSLAIDSEGMVWAWGWNNYGPLGNDSTNDQSSPVSIAQAGSYIAIAAGNVHSLAIDSAGMVWAWGYNGYSQLGNDSTNSQSSPVSISGNYVAITAGNSYSLAIDSAGMVWAWGGNDDGQLGNDSTNNQSVPVSIARAGSYAILGSDYSSSYALPAPVAADFSIRAGGSVGGNKLQIANDGIDSTAMLINGEDVEVSHDLYVDGTSYTVDASVMGNLYVEGTSLFNDMVGIGIVPTIYPVDMSTTNDQPIHIQTDENVGAFRIEGLSNFIVTPQSEKILLTSDRGFEFRTQNGKDMTLNTQGRTVLIDHDATIGNNLSFTAAGATINSLNGLVMSPATSYVEFAGTGSVQIDGTLAIGSSPSTPALDVYPNTDTSARIGYLALGNAAPFTGYAGIAHTGHADALGYAISQNSDGTTYLNSDKVVEIRQNNSLKMSIGDSSTIITNNFFCASNNVAFNNLNATSLYVATTATVAGNIITSGTITSGGDLCSYGNIYASSGNISSYGDITSGKDIIYSGMIRPQGSGSCDLTTVGGDNYIRLYGNSNYYFLDNATFDNTSLNGVGKVCTSDTTYNPTTGTVIILAREIGSNSTTLAVNKATPTGYSPFLGNNSDFKFGKNNVSNSVMLVFDNYGSDGTWRIVGQYT